MSLPLCGLCTLDFLYEGIPYLKVVLLMCFLRQIWRWGSSQLPFIFSWQSTLQIFILFSTAVRYVHIFPILHSVHNTRIILDSWLLRTESAFTGALHGQWCCLVHPWRKLLGFRRKVNINKYPSCLIFHFVFMLPVITLYFLYLKSVDCLLLQMQSQSGGGSHQAMGGGGGQEHGEDRGEVQWS